MKQIVDLLSSVPEMSGYDIAIATNIPLASIYSILGELEGEQVIGSRWGVATEERGWRRPRLYWLIKRR